MAASAEHYQAMARGANHAMVEACKRRRAQDLKAALEAGADPGSAEGSRALYLACLGAAAGCARLLLEAGARADQTSASHFSQQALQAAIAGGSVGCARLALPTSDLSLANRHGQIPLDEAKFLGRHEIAAMIEQELSHREAWALSMASARAPSKAPPRL